MNKPITGIDFLGAGDFYPKVNDETTMKLGELGWPNSAIDKANQPQRTWVGLTDEDLAVCGDEDDVMLARYWEPVCKEKNNA